MAAGPGSTIGGCVLEHELGRGGMGTVYAARTASGAPVVVKLLAPELRADAALRKRFLLEARALRRVRAHPHVVRVHAVIEGDEPAIVMERIDGPALSALLARSGRLPVAEAARIGRELALGLGALHGHGLVHRDVKPSNALLDARGRARLVDLGLAKDAFASGLTAPGQLLGTLAYMAPEQWTGGAVDARSDVFGLGATLYHLVAGTPPFPGTDPAELADGASSGRFAPLDEVAPGTPPELARVVDRALDPDPAFRHGRMEALADDLRLVLEGRPARLPALEGAAGRLPLVRGKVFGLGSAPGAALALPAAAGASGAHAEVRRRAGGWWVVDLRSAGGTFVGAERVTAPRRLADGDRLRLGQVELALVDPREGEALDPVRWDVERRRAPEPAVRALAELGDARVALWLLERLAPDPRVLGRARAALVALLGPAVAAAAEPALAAAAAQEAAWAAERLAALAGWAPDEGEPLVEWLAWWEHARRTLPGQLAPEALAPGLALRAGAGGARCAITEQAVLLVGRDARCDLRLEDATVSRLHVTLRRAHRRFMARNDDPGLGTLLAAPGQPRRALEQAFLDPGAVLTLGAAQVELVDEGPPAAPAPAALPGLPWPAHVLPLEALRALEALQHPAALLAAVQALSEARSPWPDDAARTLLPGDPARAAVFVAAARGRLAERARAARARLVAWAGGDAGDDPAAWVRVCAGRPAPAPQVVGT